MNTDNFLSLALQAMLDNTPDMLFFKDTNLIYRGGSQPFADMVGVADVKEIIGKSDFEILPAELALEYTQDDKNLLKNGVNIIDKIEPITDLDGKKRYSSTSKFIIRDEKGNTVGLCGLARDVTAQIMLMEEIEQRELANQMFEDVFEADITENRILRAEGTALTKLLNIDACATFTDAINEISNRFIHPDHREDFVESFLISNLFSEYSKGIKRYSQTVLQTIDGDNFRWVNIASRIYFSAISGTMRILMFFSDIDDDKRSRDLLRRSAQTDSLTDLLNRKSTIDEISDCLAFYGNNGTHALLFIDIDMFKQINDTFGHTAGDNVLIFISKKLKSLFRKDDIIGRIGGDEFLVLLKNVADEKEALKLAQTIFDILPEKSGEYPKATCSVGVSMYHGANKRFDVLCAEADKAMYAAKQAGRNCAVLYTEDLE